MVLYYQIQFACVQIRHTPLSGGYCGEVPPLPIPNREVKLTCADGTAMQCGRVGSRLLLLGSLDYESSRGFSVFLKFCFFSLLAFSLFYFQQISQITQILFFCFFFTLISQMTQIFSLLLFLFSHRFHRCSQIFPKSLHERYRKSENILSINELEDSVRKEC